MESIIVMLEKATHEAKERSSENPMRYDFTKIKPISMSNFDGKKGVPLTDIVDKIGSGIATLAKFQSIVSSAIIKILPMMN